MLDLRFIRENSDLVKEAVKNKGEDVNVDELLKLDEKRRKLISQAEKLKHQKNVFSEKIAGLKMNKKDFQADVEKMKEVSKSISELDKSLKQINEKLNELLLKVPNIPHASVPVGADESCNLEIRSWGELPRFDFEPRPHWEIGKILGILDLPRAAKVSGSGFLMFLGLGAKLERALINFMLDLHVKKHGYKEIFPPFLVNRSSMTGTGQLPKLEEDMYLTEKDDLFLIPTAEVPVTNIYRDEMLKEDDLPLNFASYTACFRSEAGTYGKDTRGMIRVHQFDKVELVKFVKPENSYQELENLVDHAEEVLKLLGLPYRVRNLCTGDLSFAAAKCYDLEAWACGLGKHLEVSSCSNFEDFQARRIGIKYRTKKNNKPEFLHTLNGSGVALPRTMICILENYQTKKGTVKVPEVLKPYMDGIEEIE